MTNDMGAVEQRLRRAHLHVQEQVLALDQAKAELLDAVTAGRAAGMSLAALAALLGITKARAQQLSRQADGRGRSKRT